MSEKLNSKQLLNQLTQKHYNDAKAAKERGGLVAWSTSVAPQELCETMGIEVLYPENHAAAIGAKGGAIPLLEYSEGNGYSIDLCSYARINLAYMETEDCCFENMPLPDLIICCNNICNTLIKWYENIARELNIPMIMIDVPFNHDYEVSQERIDYIKGQFKEAIWQLEEICGRPFDYQRFEEVMKISAESAKTWKYAMGLASNVPSPLNGFNIFNYMALIVCMRGKPESIQLFKLVAQELEELIENGGSQFPAKEEYRVMWEGIACWPFLGHNFKTLKKYGINVVGSTYPDAWALIYDANDLDGMARAYASVMNNCGVDYQSDLRTRIIKDFKCDGAIYHMNRSCKLMDFMQFEMQRRVAENTGVPYVVFDGDQTDPRNFAQAQFETKVQALVEMMEQNKAAKNEEVK
ncbi:MAG: 2-hydroxyacyl-CoA dehydratase family protein [Bacillota bacterium]|nr:2-hydroxyacyl-CoA dehydratase family protein [Bacillota bacterium]